MKRLPEKPWDSGYAIRIAITFAVVGYAWIVASEYAIAALVLDKGMMLLLQMGKGIIYTSAVAVLLFYTIDGIRRRHEALKEVQYVREIEATLRENEARLRVILDSLPVGVVIADAGARVVEANPAVERILHGRLPRAANLGGYSVYTGRWRITGKAVKPDEWPLTRAILTGEIVQNAEIDFLCYDGLERPLLLWAAPTKTADGKVTGGVAVFQDITELRNAQLALQDARDELAARAARLEEAHHRLQHAQSQLVQSEKLAVIGQLAAGIAHEINNPLSYVSGNIEVLRRDFQAVVEIYTLYARAAAEENANQRHLLLQSAQAKAAELDVDYILSNLQKTFDWTVDGTERIRRIVIDMRSFARIGEAKWKRINLNQAVETTVRVVSYRLKKKGITVDQDYAEAVEAYCMPDRINQVILNLLVNAIDAVPRGGAIRITTRADHEGATIAIADNGPGIPKDVLPRIFDPFFTTKIGGTGLGLSISQSIIDEHGGRIDVQSEEGKGTTFTVWLPKGRDHGESGEAGAGE
ncbi:MAG TPA: ATP-binding protein [Planctomycetota bacterium]|nr:ATP-binding protein [Planctomycetota bacterium]